jgi:hypothetical protein
MSSLQGIQFRFTTDSLSKDLHPIDPHPMYPLKPEIDGHTRLSKRALPRIFNRADRLMEGSGRTPSGGRRPERSRISAELTIFRQPLCLRRASTAGRQQ